MSRSVVRAVARAVFAGLVGLFVLGFARSAAHAQGWHEDERFGFKLLAPRGSDWDTPLVGGTFAMPPVPGPEVYDLRSRRRGRTSPAIRGPRPDDVTRRDERDAAAIGSNNFAVAASLTPDEGALVANDMHLSIRVPNTWYRASLQWPAPVDSNQLNHVTGVTLPGVPAILVGSNTHIAWGFTNTQADVADMYVERLSPDGTQYEFKGKWHRVRTIREKIFVRGQAKPLIHEVRETRHGPLITSVIAGGTQPEVVEGRITETVALRWIQQDLPLSQRAPMLLNRASTWEEFRAAGKAWPIAGQNMVYADVDGNIGYQLTGHYPIRRAGDGTVPVPGWTSDYEWQGWVPFDELPRAFNPDDAFLCTANNKVYDDGYPHNLGRDFLPPFRVRRIAQLLTERERHS